MAGPPARPAAAAAPAPSSPRRLPFAVAACPIVAALAYFGIAALLASKSYLSDADTVRGVALAALASARDFETAHPGSGASNVTLLMDDIVTQLQGRYGAAIGQEDWVFMRAGGWMKHHHGTAQLTWNLRSVAAA